MLDVDRIVRLSAKLGPNVTCSRITGAIHDVFLSQPPARRRAFDALSDWLTEEAPELSAGVPEPPSGP